MYHIADITFRLRKSFIENYKGKQPNWGAMGYIVFKRTYARPLCADCGSYDLFANGLSLNCKPCSEASKASNNIRNEEYYETLQRVVNGTFSILKNRILSIGTWDEERAHRTAEKMYKTMWDFGCLPPGRGLWTMGTKHLVLNGGMSLNNCAFVSTSVDDPNANNSSIVDPFIFLMDAMMLGVGVGFDTLGSKEIHYIHKPNSNNSVNYLVEDSREGWCGALEALLCSYLKPNNSKIVFDYSKIRPENTPIVTFGGVSSGPKPLMIMIENITKVLENRLNSITREVPKLRSSDIVDIMNHIGTCVVSGNVRRGAELAIGSPDDTEFINLKQDKEALSSHRWASNNSIISDDINDYSSFAELTATNGEPGYIWMNNIRRFGRLKDLPNNLDSKVMGLNPCAEQTLESYEVCNLVENFICNVNSLSDFLSVLKCSYLYAKAVTLVPIHNPITNRIVERNRRIGASHSGVTNAFAKFGRNTVLHDWCDKGYKYVEALDIQYSEWLGIPQSIKKTSVKPSGTVSLLPDCVNPGIHYGMSEYYIRRMRIASNSPLVPCLINAGYHVEPSVNGFNTLVVSFPMYDKFFTRSESDVTMWEQLENAAQYQYYWADNSVSVTIKVKEHEKSQIQYALELYKNRLKAVSFLPYDNHSYEQAPIEPITKEQYELMASKINPNLLYESVSQLTLSDNDGGKNAFCDSQKCELPPK